MRRIGLGLLVGATVSLCSPAASAAQKVETLSAACSAAGGDPTLCAASALAGRDLLGHVGVLSGLGSEVPGESSTLGRRLGGMPRIALFMRAAGHSANVPDLADASGSGRVSHFVPSMQAGVALGVFDGFRIMPTVGGVLSVDLIGQAAFAFFSEDDGFGGRVDALSFGARVGVFQESFTLPGVSVSITRRGAGKLSLGGAGFGDPAQVVVDPTVTSLRATAAKDLFALGVLVGVAWDDYSSDTSLRVTDGAGVVVPVSGELEASRWAYFAGASRQIGILAWISAEVGFVRSFDAVPGLAGLVAQPDDVSVFGSLALLLKL